MEIDQAAEWRRLTEHYRTLYDDELLNLAADSGDLTAIAQQVLNEEIKRRALEEQQERPNAAAEWSQPGLPPPSTWESTPSLVPSAESDQGTQSSGGYTWKTLLCECNEREQAWQIQEFLRLARIECWIEAPSPYSLELSGPRVLVAADQLEQARAIIAQPIPRNIVEDSKIEVPEYELPICPHCGAADPILDAVDPVNVWLCEVCGKDWRDPVAGRGE